MTDKLNKALATRVQLELMWGHLEDWGATLVRTSMGRREVWKRISGSGDKALFEFQLGNEKGA